VLLQIAGLLLLCNIVLFCIPDIYKTKTDLQAMGSAGGATSSATGRGVQWVTCHRARNDFAHLDKDCIAALTAMVLEL
jgi:hypothetical protein